MTSSTELRGEIVVTLSGQLAIERHGTAQFIRLSQEASNDVHQGAFRPGQQVVVTIEDTVDGKFAVGVKEGEESNQTQVDLANRPRYGDQVDAKTQKTEYKIRSCSTNPDHRDDPRDASLPHHNTTLPNDNASGSTPAGDGKDTSG